jgi:hypothetical protein
MPPITSEDFLGLSVDENNLDTRLDFLDTLGTQTPDDTLTAENFLGIDTVVDEVRKPVQSSDVWDWLPDVFKKGYNESLTGMAQQIATGEVPFDIEDYHPSVLKDITANVISFLIPTDLLTFGITGGAGAIAAKKAGQMALKQMAKAGVKKKFAEKTLKEGMETLVAKAGVSAGTGATALGVYSGVADAMVQQIDDGNIDWGRTAKSAAKGAVLGGAVGAIGGRAAFKGTSEAGRIAQEIAAFGIGSPALELRLPTPQDFVHAGGMILGIRGATGVAKAGWRAATGQPIIQPQVKAKKA